MVNNNRLEYVTNHILDMPFLFLVLGVFATLTPLEISLGGMSLTIFNLLLIVIVGKRIVIDRNFGLYFKGELSYFLFAGIVLLSTICNFYSSEMAWSKANLVKSINVCILYMGVVILFSTEEKKKLLECFIKGLYISCLIQMIWGWLQFFAWELFNQSINQLVFSELLGINSEGVEWTVVKDGHLRLSGFGWEAAYFSLALIVVYLLTPKIYMKLIVAIEICASTSRTGLVLLIVCIMLEVVVTGKFKEYAKKNSRLFYLGVLAAVCLIGFVLVNPSLISLEGIFDRLESTIMSLVNKDSSSQTHTRYYTACIGILGKSNWVQRLIGYGISSSGLPFSIYLNQYTNLGPWSIESDIVATLMGTGILGCICYYYWSIKKLFNLNVKDLSFSLLFVILIGGVFYIYIGTWTIVFIALLSETKASLWKDIYKIQSK